MFIGYFARKANKPRIIAVTILFSAVGGYLFALPHFMTFPSHDQQLSQSIVDSQSQNLTLSKSRSYIELFDSNRPMEDCSLKKTDGSSASSSAGIHPAYYFFFISQLISGVGISGVFTLILAYIDENAPTSNSAFYIGLLQIHL